MAFDPSKPADDEKIRNLGTVIRANWQGIEQAESSFKPYALNFVDRNTIGGGVPAQPAKIAGTGQLYSKQNGASTKVELFYLDNAGTPNEVQLTTDGELGVTTQNVQFLALNDGTRTFDKDDFLSVWGYITFDAGINIVANVGSNCTITKASNTQIDVAFGANYNMSSANYLVIPFIQTTVGAASDSLFVGSKTTAGFSITVGASMVSRVINFIVMGSIA